MTDADASQPDHTGRRLSDPLLAATRLCLGILTALTGFWAVTACLAVPTMIVMHDLVDASLARHGAPPGSATSVILLTALGAITGALWFLFLRSLRRIVITVTAGDPFIPENADRLHAMGWFALGIQVLGVPMGAITHWVSHVTRDIQINSALPFTGIVLALALFVLARVFREGARMREELEGTV